MELFAGTAPEHMHVQIYDSSVQLFAELTNDDFTLTDYNIQNGMIAYVIDNDPNNTIRSLQDDPSVEKYVMTDEDYAKRDNTYRKWKEENPDKAPQKVAKPEEQFPSHIKVGKLFQ